MVYMYYGFFLFLLYMTAPLWIFIPVAILSGWAMRSSTALQKNMKMTIGRLGSRGSITLETKRGLKPRTIGVWVERRKFNRVAASLDVTYEALENGWKKNSVSAFSEHPAADSLLPLAKRFKSGKAVIRDISEGGLCITGEESFAVGEQLKLFLRFPEANAPITILAEVRSARATLEPGGNTYKAGLKIIDLDLQDMVHLLDYLFAERFKQKAS